MNEKISLYAIAEGFQQLNEMADDDEMLVPYLDAITMQLDNKVDNIVKFRQEKLATVAAIDSEVQRLLAMKKSHEKLAERLKEYVSTSMILHDIEKIDTGLFKVSFLNSESVEVTDESLISDEFKKVKTVFQVDKLALKAALKAGKVVQGAEIVRRKNLQIK